MPEVNLQKFRGSWRQCANYEADDVVLFDGIMYKALGQNAGKPPRDEAAFWEPLDDEEKKDIGDKIPVYKHNDLEGRDGTTADATFHITEDEAKALADRAEDDELNADNHVASMKNVEDAIAELTHDALAEEQDEDSDYQHITKAELDAVRKALTPSAVPEGEEEVPKDLATKDMLLDPDKLPLHDEFNEIHVLGTGEIPWHIGDTIAGAIIGATEPSEDNHFVTIADLPMLGKGLGPWNKIDLPEGFGVVYGLCFDDEAGILCIVGDNAVAWYDGAAAVDKWTVQKLAGTWRAVTQFSDGKWVAVGTNCAAVGFTAALANVGIRDGRYNAIATNGARAVAVGDSVVSYLDSGAASFVGVDTPEGYGEGICYHPIEAVFYTIGRAGVRYSADLVAWNNDYSIPSATWRDIKYGDGMLIACSGKIAYRRDDKNVWAENEIGFGGWENIAVGNGYTVAVTNSRCAVSAKKPPRLKEISIPDFAYLCVAFGGGAFWAAGSALVVARFRDVAAALAEAEDPNYFNPVVTRTELERRVTEMQEDIELKLVKILRAMRLRWGGAFI